MDLFTTFDDTLAEGIRRSTRNVVEADLRISKQLEDIYDVNRALGLSTWTVGIKSILDRKLDRERRVWNENKEADGVLLGALAEGVADWGYFGSSGAHRRKLRHTLANHDAAVDPPAPPASVTNSIALPSFWQVLSRSFQAVLSFVSGAFNEEVDPTPEAFADHRYWVARAQLKHVKNGAEVLRLFESCRKTFLPGEAFAGEHQLLLDGCRFIHTIPDLVALTEATGAVCKDIKDEMLVFGAERLASRPDECIQLNSRATYLPMKRRILMAGVWLAKGSEDVLDLVLAAEDPECKRALLLAGLHIVTSSADLGRLKSVIQDDQLRSELVELHTRCVATVPDSNS